MQLSHKVRIFPTLDQERVLWDLAEKCRLVYNFALQEWKENWEQEKDKPTKDQHRITYTKQQNDLPALKIRFPEYTWPHSKSLQECPRRKPPPEGGGSSLLPIMIRRQQNDK